MNSGALYLFTVLAVAASFAGNAAKTRRALAISARALMAIAPRVLGMIALIGLVLAIVPPDYLRRIFGIGGLGGFVLVAGIGSLITLPGPIAFPLAGSLLRLGAPPATLATFITTLTMVGTVTAPMEIAAFGRRFTLMRQCLSFLAAVLIGLLMGVFL